MKEIACIGTESFTLGFRLAGMRKTTTVTESEKCLEALRKLKEDASIGIVIVDEVLLKPLETHDRTEIEDSVNPVFISLSTEESSESIRKLIIKSIGVDLWK